MDGDPAIEPELDGFTRILPLPYRVAIIIVFGALLCIDILSAFTNPLLRNLGLGPQPALPLPDQDRRPLSDPISISLVSTSSTAPPVYIPSRDLPQHPSSGLASLVLDYHSWRLKTHQVVGAPAEPIPPGAGSRICSSSQLPLALRTVADTGNIKAD